MNSEKLSDSDSLLLLIYRACDGDRSRRAPLFTIADSAGWEPQRLYRCLISLGKDRLITAFGREVGLAAAGIVRGNALHVAFGEASRAPMMGDVREAGRADVEGCGEVL